MDAPSIQYARTEDGVNIAFWTLGEGEPLIEQPQAPYSHCEGIWRAPWAQSWFSHLAARRQIVYFDHRGHGLSDREAIDYSPEVLALDIAAVADRLGLDCFDLFGAGFVSPAAILFAAEHPQRVRRLALWQPLSHGAARFGPGKDMLPLIDENFDFFLESVVRFGDPDLTPKQMAIALASLRLCVDPPALRAAYEAYAQVDVRDALGRVQAPTLVFDRRGDRALRETALAEVAAALPRGSLRLLEGKTTGPFTHEDWEPAALALEEFLDAPDEGALTLPAAQVGTPLANLTPREGEVLALVASGQRNRDIAERLAISPATVTRHISNILTKTGCSNRTELGRYATDHGLAGNP